MGDHRSYCAVKTKEHRGRDIIYQLIVLLENVHKLRQIFGLFLTYPSSTYQEQRKRGAGAFHTMHASKTFQNAKLTLQRETVGLDTFQDFLIKLDIKPLIHLLEISIFSQNNVILRLTKKLWTELTKIGHIFSK